MARQGSYPLNGRVPGPTDTATGVVAGATADIPLADIAALAPEPSIATTTTPGIVQPDGVTITVNEEGVITAVTGGTGTVTSVGLALPSDFNVSGSPVTSSGTLTGTWNPQLAHAFLGGPDGGTGAPPTFRTLESTDLPLGTTSAPGALQPDGTTITVAGGVITAVGGGGGSGTVTSVGLALPASILTVSGTPVTTTGTLTGTLATQTANEVWAGPTTGTAAAPTFRHLVTADLPAGTGTVTSAGLTMPAQFSVAGSPVTTAGTLAVTWNTETAHTVLAGPTTGTAAPTFRALASADLPLGTTSAPGALQPDGTSITVTGGVISAVTGGSGTVTSVGLALPASILTVSGSPVTGAGTLTGALATQTAATVWAGPATGTAAAPTFRALAGTDLPLGTTSAPGALQPDGTTITVTGGVISAVAGGAGTVTSVGVSMPAQFAVANSPVTTSGTIAVTWNTETANTFLAGPTTGGAAAPTFRGIVSADLPLGTTGAAGALRPDGTTITVAGGVITAVGGGSGTVTSVGLSLPTNVFALSGTPVTGTGTLTGTFLNQTANQVWAGPVSGGTQAPTFRTLVTADIPSSIARSGTNGDITSLVGLTTPLTVPQGGMGAGTHTVHGVIIGQGASAVTTTSAGTAGQVLTSNGASADPTFQVIPVATSAIQGISQPDNQTLIVASGVLSRQFRGARVYQSGSITAPAAGSAFTFNTVDYDTGVAGTNFWNVAQPTRLTAPVTGYYRIIGQAGLSFTALVAPIAAAFFIGKNGTSGTLVPANLVQAGIPTGVAVLAEEVTCVLPLAATDFVELFINVAFTAGTTQTGRCWLSLEFLGT